MESQKKEAGLLEAKLIRNRGLHGPIGRLMKIRFCGKHFYQDIVWLAAHFFANIEELNAFALKGFSGSSTLQVKHRLVLEFFLSRRNPQ